MYGEKAILATELRELQSRVHSLSDDRDESLADLDEVNLETPISIRNITCIFFLSLVEVECQDTSGTIIFLFVKTMFVFDSLILR